MSAEAKPQRAVLRAESLHKRYVQRRPLSRRAYRIEALRDVSLEVPEGCDLALIGESGSGKSTLARCLALLERPDSGRVWLEGTDLTALSAGKLRAFRPRVQVIFQGTSSAFSPQFSAREVVEEPLLIQKVPREERWARALAAMELVGLPARWAERNALELSGGQRQRLGIARAMALEPRLLILDEALSGLDRSIQAQVVNLLLELRERRGVTCLWISHDLELVSRFAQVIAVMHQGRLVEQGAAAALLAEPQHPHTRELVAAAFRRQVKGAGA